MLKPIPGKVGSFEDTETGKTVSIVSEEEIYKLRLLTLVKCLADERDRRAVDKRGVFDVFNMESFYNPACKTPACVLGTYASRRDLQTTFTISHNGLSLIEDPDALVWPDDQEVLRHFGITEEEARALFDADGCNDA
jgi:hypothetical protein